MFSEAAIDPPYLRLSRDSSAIRSSISARRAGETQRSAKSRSENKALPTTRARFRDLQDSREARNVFSKLFDLFQRLPCARHRRLIVFINTAVTRLAQHRPLLDIREPKTLFFELLIFPSDNARARAPRSETATCQPVEASAASSCRSESSSRRTAVQRC